MGDREYDLVYFGSQKYIVIRQACLKHTKRHTESIQCYWLHLILN